MTMKLSRYHVVTQPCVDEIDEQVKRVIFATRTAEVRIINEAAWHILESEKFDSLPKAILSDLIDIELLVPASEDELTTILSRNKGAAEDSDCLYMVIQPTAHCQLGCGYCGQEHTNKWLNANHQDLFLERQREKLKAERYHKLLVCWFGAEPLSGLGVMRSFTPRLRALAEEFNCTYEARIITNGLALTDKVATEIVNDLAVRDIHITLDGTAEYHNVRRHRKNGKATFEQIFSNTIALARRQDLDTNLNVRCNVDRRNYEGVLPLMQMLAEAGVQERINFYVAPIHSWGNDAHTLSLSTEEFAEWEIKWLAQMIELGFNPGLTPGRKPIVCLAVMPQGDLVDAHGSLFNCTEVSYVPTYGTPNKFAIGHVSSGEILGKRNLLGDFNARVGRGEYLCSSCRMLPVCGGACPKLWHEGIIPCPSTKYNIEERLLLSYATSRLVNEPSSIEGTETTEAVSGKE